MKILSAVLKRCLQLAILSLLVASATFALASLIPGDFFSPQELDPGVHRQTVDAERQRHGLDQPFAVRYARWLQRCVHMDLGTSLFYERPVRGVVLDALSKTLWIALPALILALAGGIILGTLHAQYRDSAFGSALDLASNLALSLPTIVLGLGALLLAAATGWFPLGSMSSSNLQAAGFISWLADRAHHLVLPVICLAVPILVYVEKIQSAATGEILSHPCVRAARARGLCRTRIFFGHTIRPALNPLLSTLGPLLGSILSGSLVLEVIFSWPGLGQVTLNALVRMDLPLVIGCVVGSTVLLVVGNLSADLLLLLLDPRTRIAERGL